MNDWVFFVIGFISALLIVWIVLFLKNRRNSSKINLDVDLETAHVKKFESDNNDNYNSHLLLLSLLEKTSAPGNFKVDSAAVTEKQIKCEEDKIYAKKSPLMVPSFVCKEKQTVSLSISKTKFKLNLNFFEEGSENVRLMGNLNLTLKNVITDTSVDKLISTKFKFGDVNTVLNFDDKNQDFVLSYLNQTGLIKTLNLKSLHFVDLPTVHSEISKFIFKNYKEIFNMKETLKIIQDAKSFKLENFSLQEVIKFLILVKKEELNLNTINEILVIKTKALKAQFNFSELKNVTLVLKHFFNNFMNSKFKILKSVLLKNTVANVKYLKIGFFGYFFENEEILKFTIEALNNEKGLKFKMERGLF
ncbi:hypothetical protein HDU92_004919 [Lobulomyces angularis]|nr:hypothetical protein HDU92_004919 [Lobulomyces angularis]